MISDGVNRDNSVNASSLIAKLSEQTRQAQTADSQNQTKNVNSPEKQIGSSRRTLLQELENMWGVKVGVTTVGSQGNKAFAMGMVNAGISRSVGISPVAMQRMQNDPSFEEEVTQNVTEHIKTFDRMMSAMPGENKAYGLLVDDEGNISSWSYVEHNSGGNSKEEYWKKLQEETEEARLEKIKDQQERLEDGDGESSNANYASDANNSGLSDLVKTSLIVDITT